MRHKVDAFADDVKHWCADVAEVAYLTDTPARLLYQATGQKISVEKLVESFFAENRRAHEARPDIAVKKWQVYGQDEADTVKSGH